MSTIRHTFLLPDAEFKTASEPTALDVRISKPTNRGHVYFRLTLPDYLFKRLQGLSSDYGADFTAIVEDLTFYGLCQRVEVMVQDSLYVTPKENQYGEKKLLVYVKTNAKQERSDYAGARREFLVSIEFGFFPAWVLDEQPPAIVYGDETIPRPRRQQIYSAKTSSHHSSTANLANAKTGYSIPDENDLVEMCHSGTSGYSFKSVLGRYKVLDYTPEREAFLQTIQDRLTAITGSLSEFFASINEESVDQLMAANPQFLLNA